MEAMQSRSPTNIWLDWKAFSMEIYRNDRLQSAKQWFHDLPGRRAELAQRRRLFVHHAERQIGLTPLRFPASNDAKRDWMDALVAPRTTQNFPGQRAHGPRRTDKNDIEIVQRNASRAHTKCGVSVRDIARFSFEKGGHLTGILLEKR